MHITPESVHKQLPINSYFGADLITN